MLGKFAREIGLSSSVLTSGDKLEIRIVPSKLTVGLALELFSFAKEQFRDPSGTCCKWFAEMCDLDSVPKAALQTKLYKLLAAKKQKGGKDMNSFLNKMFVLPSETQPPQAPSELPLPVQSTATVPQSLPSTTSEALRTAKYENMLLKRKLVRREQQTEKAKLLKIDLTKQVKENKKSETKITKSQNQLVQLKDELKASKLNATEKDNMASVLQLSNDELSETLCNSVEMLEKAQKRADEAELQVSNLQVDNEYLSSLLQDQFFIPTWDDTTGAFTSNVTECVMNLLDQNVSSAHVPGVIKTVSELCGCTVSKLPSRTTVDRISDMRVSVSQKQLEALTEKENLTLYSDETSKYGKSYEVFAVTDENKNSYLLGLREMYCKSSASVLDTLKEILSDIDNIAGNTDVGAKVLCKIKNTMSDRASTEKKFHSLLEDYRKEILPTVKEGWLEMNEEEKQTCGRMNNFFCGLHLLVNFADVCAEALRKFENLVLEKKVGAEVEEDSELKKGEKTHVKKDESGTIRLIRCCSKAFAKGADEKSGVYGEFKTYIESKKDKVGFVRFKHNRFNILFLMGGVTYHHRENVKDFLENFHGITNRLLKAIIADIEVPVFVAGCRALGIISKMVTAPLWRIIESSGHILEMGEVLSNLENFFKEGKNKGEEILDGKLYPFEGNWDRTEDPFKENANIENLTVQILQCLCEAMLVLLQRQAADHLEEGKYHAAPALIWEEAKSVLRHNKLPEFFFGQLDYLMRHRPNASTLCNEAFVLFSHNKTGQWLESLDAEEKEALLSESRKEGKRIRARFQERVKAIEMQCLEKQKRKEHELKERKLRVFQRNEKMTEDIIYFGLWQTDADVTNHLQEISSNTEKVKAVKAQLTFRKNVLKQAANANLFKFSSGKKKRSLDELCSNLLQLIGAAKTGAREERRDAGKPLLVGKQISHRFVDKWYSGHVLSVVPSFPEWYNVKYTGDEAIYVYRLQQDYANGDLKIVVLSSH